jgi:hypothetical protein
MSEIEIRRRGSSWNSGCWSVPGVTRDCDHHDSTGHLPEKLDEQPPIVSGSRQRHNQRLQARDGGRTGAVERAVYVVRKEVPIDGHVADIGIKSPDVGRTTIEINRRRPPAITPRGLVQLTDRLR